MTERTLRLFIAACIGVAIGALTIALVRHLDHRPSGVYIRGPKLEFRLDE